MRSRNMRLVAGVILLSGPLVSLHVSGDEVQGFHALGSVRGVQPGLSASLSDDELVAIVGGQLAAIPGLSVEALSGMLTMETQSAQQNHAVPPNGGQGTHHETVTQSNSTTITQTIHPDGAGVNSAIVTQSNSRSADGQHSEVTTVTVLSKVGTVNIVTEQINHSELSQAPGPASIIEALWNALPTEALPNAAQTLLKALGRGATAIPGGPAAAFPQPHP